MTGAIWNASLVTADRKRVDRLDVAQHVVQAEAIVHELMPRSCEPRGECVIGEEERRCGQEPGRRPI